jgi:predicted peptidase
LPYVIVSPQCPRSDRWSSDIQQKRLTELLDAVYKQYRINEAGVFLTGLSMGGYGTWAMATNSPKRFAAVVPICGGGDPTKAANLVDVPIWVFHGDQDKPVPFEKSLKMVDAIKKAGGTKVRFTTMENVGHNCWSAAYATPELYHWMFAQIKD